jgi:hypothetical protein
VYFEEDSIRSKTITLIKSCVITYSCKGMFSFEVGHWVTRCERRGLKNPQMCFIQGRQLHPSLFFNDKYSLQAGQIESLNVKSRNAKSRCVDYRNVEVPKPEICGSHPIQWGHVAVD